VSSFVRRGAPLDVEAQARGNSVYLPRLVIPMLPETLSNGVCSLQEGVPRFTKSAFITFDGRGRVLSQRFAMSFEGDRFNLYRALRQINPSPYLFYLDFEEVALIGSSPEVLVRVDEGRVELLPIAGTRHRGATPEEDAALADELRAFFERLEMERLLLRDRSVREEWERGRLRDEMQVLEDREQSLRERLGDDAYDAYLYASGQTNRVEVSSVLESAQAGQAGIRSGDYIIRYDNERIYNWRDLRNATTSGEITDTIEVEVERDGETLQFYLARGPLGIRMNSLRVAP